MSKKIQLQVATPCHENWDNMDPVEQGRFCGSCQKQVVDFSDMSDRQIAEFFKKPSTGSVCGRFMTDQLDRQIAIPRKQLPWIKYFFQFALPAFLISLKASGQSRPTMGKVANVQCVKPREDSLLRNMGDVAIVSSIKIITGKVVDEKGEPLSSVTVLQKGTKNAVVTDAKGSFRISLPRNANSIVVSLVGYEIAEIVLDKDQTAVNVVLKTLFAMKTMGVVCYFPKKQLTKQEKTIQNFNLRGTVVEGSSLKPIPGATVKILNSHNGVSANEDGVFHLPITDVSKPVKLEVSSIGYGTRIVEYNAGGGYARPVLEVQLTPSIVIIPQVVVVAPKKYVVGELRSQVYRTTIFSDSKKPVIPPEARFKVFPNPVQSNSTMHIEWKQSEFGYYSLQLLNQSGQLVLNKEIFIDKDARVLSIDVPNVAAGSYFLKMTSKKSGRLFAEKIVID